MKSKLDSFIPIALGAGFGQAFGDLLNGNFYSFFTLVVCFIGIIARLRNVVLENRKVTV